MKVLLIGGSHAGKTMDVDDGLPSFQLTPALQGFQTRVGVRDPEVYLRGELADSTGKGHVVYVADGVEPLQALMDVYRDQ